MRHPNGASYVIVGQHINVSLAKNLSALRCGAVTCSQVTALPGPAAMHATAIRKVGAGLMHRMGVAEVIKTAVFFLL